MKIMWIQAYTAIEQQHVYLWILIFLRKNINNTKKKEVLFI
jgi:hypothetical protein